MSWYWGSQETPTGRWSTTASPLASRLACVTITPFGSLVDPEVYCRKASGWWAPRISASDPRGASVVTIQGSPLIASRLHDQVASRRRAWFTFIDQAQPRSVKIAEAPQSSAMKFIFASADAKPWVVGGYTGTGTSPSRIAAKNAQITSSPGG